MKGGRDNTTYHYGILRDSFFRYQTKPRLSGLGDLYYEGKELQLLCRNFQPGVLSDCLKEALGMGSNFLMPPP
jgi:splicing factor 3B subunit 2